MPKYQCKLLQFLYCKINFSYFIIIIVIIIIIITCTHTHERILVTKKVAAVSCMFVCLIDDWKPEVSLKDPYWSPTSPTTDDNLITSTESEDMRYGRHVFVFILNWFFQSPSSISSVVHCVSKNDTDVTHYRFNPHQPISVIFDRDVAERVCYWMMIYYPTSPN